jgi:hypothetical protein
VPGEVLRRNILSNSSRGTFDQSLLCSVLHFVKEDQRRKDDNLLNKIANLEVDVVMECNSWRNNRHIRCFEAFHFLSLPSISTENKLWDWLS